MTYRKTVIEYARQQLNMVFPNGTIEHAAAITEAMLLAARGSFKVYTGNFSPEFYGRPEITHALNDFFERDAFPRIKVLVQHPMTTEMMDAHPWTVIAKKHDRTIKIRNAVGNYATDEPSHFSIVDNSGYRYEFDKDCRATANFYDTKTVAKLDEVFEQAFSYAA